MPKTRVHFLFNLRLLEFHWDTLITGFHHIEYVLHRVILPAHPEAGNSRFRISLNRDSFTVAGPGGIYTEKVFDFERPEISTVEIKALTDWIQALEKTQGNAVAVPPLLTDSIFRLTQFFCNEKYFSEERKYDPHERILFESVRQEIQPILKFPVVDLLHQYWLTRMGFDAGRRHRQLYFTCDYDYMSFRHSFTAWKFWRRQAKWLLRLRFDILFPEIHSRIFSESSEGANLLFRTDPFAFGFEKNLKNRPDVSVCRLAFLLLHAPNRKWDFSNSVKGKAAQRFLRKLEQERVTLGIHPSYNTPSNPALFEAELQGFRNDVGYSPENVRFHYLRARIPQEIQLIENSLPDASDHSFYFTESLAFRGGISKPFYPWNVAADRPFSVRMVPITLMDCTLDQYLKLDFENAVHASVEKVRRAFFMGSSVSLLWHNNYFYPHFYEGSYQADLYFKILSALKEFVQPADSDTSDQPGMEGSGR